jgi:hypothetical protein
VCWTLSYRSDRYCTPVRPIEPIPKQVQSTGLVQSLYQVPETFTGHVQSWTRLVRWTIWPLEFKLHRTSPAYTGHVRVLTQNLLIHSVSFRKWPEPVCGHPTSLIDMVDRSNRSAIIAPTASFTDYYKTHSTPSIVICWFLTVWITFQQPLELSPTSLCEIQVLYERFLSWVESFVCEH